MNIKIKNIYYVMTNKYFTAIAKEKYDCFSFALEEVIKHNKKTYVYGLREFNYYIFTSNINEKVIMEEKDCIYSLTSGMRQENEEYIKEEYKHYLQY